MRLKDMGFDPKHDGVFSGWAHECNSKARAVGMTCRHAVSPDGDAVILENATQPWSHKGECFIMVSPDKGMLAGYICRWYGVKTGFQQDKSTTWVTSLDAALKLAVQRYQAEEAVWRLGG